jgi:hypothetical protein
LISSKEERELVGCVLLEQELVPRRMRRDELHGNVEILEGSHTRVEVVS